MVIQELWLIKPVQSLHHCTMCMYKELNRHKIFVSYRHCEEAVRRKLLAYAEDDCPKQVRILNSLKTAMENEQNKCKIVLKTKNSL